jgi:hypothetical protein
MDSMIWLRNLSIALLGRFGRRLRFPHLLLITGLLLALDLVLPDGLPFIDEVVLALLTLLFASWKNGDRIQAASEPPSKTTE